MVSSTDLINLEDITNKLSERIDLCELVVIDEANKLKKLEFEEKQQNALHADTELCGGAMSKFEENLKKIDSFQKIIYSQDLASISSLITSITKKGTAASEPVTSISSEPSKANNLVSLV